MVTAKPLACGIPLGVIMANEKAAAAIKPGMHGTTFGGGALACRVALEFCDILDELLPAIQRVGGYFHVELNELARKHAFIKEVRGFGLMLGVELRFPASRSCWTPWRKACCINCTHDTVLRFLPPYIVTEKEVDQAVKMLRQGLRQGEVMRLLAIALLALLPRLAAAQTNPAAQAARTWREAHERAILAEFMTLLAMPNLARDTEDIRKNAAAVSRPARKARREDATPGSSRRAARGLRRNPARRARTRTIVFYAHYDGQPLDPKEWATPPWEPVLRDRPLDRTAASALPLRERSIPSGGSTRVASDDKAPIVAIATALDALKASRIAASNIKFVFEGEEEAGSPHLAQIIAQQGPAGRATSG